MILSAVVGYVVNVHITRLKAVHISGMTRLQELWEWQKKKKEQQLQTSKSGIGAKQPQTKTNPTTKLRTNPSKLQKPTNVPRYMQPTTAVSELCLCLAVE